MKVIIKAVTAGNELTEDQRQILRRVGNVLQQHNFSVLIQAKVKTTKTIKLKAS